MRQGSSFLACLSLWLVNEKVRNRFRGIDKLYGFYLRYANGQTHVNQNQSNSWLIDWYWFTCAWLHHPLKLLPRALLSCTDSSHQDGFMLRLICMFLGCDMLVLSSEYDDYDRLEDRLTSRATQYVTFYAWTNRLTHFLPVIYQLLFVLTSVWKQA